MKFGIASLLFLLLPVTFTLDLHAQLSPGPVAGDFLSDAIRKGRVTEALNKLEADASEAEKSSRWDRAAIFYGEASRAARVSGRLQKAVSHANKAFDMAEKAREPFLQTYAISRLSEAFTGLGQYEKSREWIEKGLERAKLIPAGSFRDSAEARLYYRLGIQLLRNGKAREAIDSLSLSVQSRESLISGAKQRRSKALTGHQRAMVSTLVGLGDAYQKASMLDQAIESYEKGLKIINEGKLKTYQDVPINEKLGTLYLQKKNYASAEANLKRALETAEELHLSHVVNRAGNSMGRLSLEAGKPADAITYYSKAIESVESVRSLLESEELRSSFFENKGQSYVGIIQAFLATNKIDEAFNYNERARSRAFLDILGSKVQLSRQGTLTEEGKALQQMISDLNAKLASQRGDDEEEGETDQRQLRKELEAAQKSQADYIAKVRKENKEQASLMNVEPLTLKQTQELLEPGVTMLEYFVTPQQVLIWVIEKDRVRFVQSPIGRKNLVSKVSSFRESVLKLGEIEKVRASAQDLYRILIEPALPHIKGQELIIVPHDTLHYVPFHALLSPEGRYLVESYAIHYLSSASLMQFTRAKSKAGGEKVLAFGNPDLGDPALNLRFAELEAREINRLYPQSTLLLKKEATEDKAKGLSPQNDIVHFATHAELSEEDPLASAILLASGGKEDGRLEVREIFGMDLHASLIVLSACETGLGKLSSGDELVGLTRAFIYAGTPSVMASLWKVEDSSTATLMASFYKKIKNISKVEALRQAQLELIRGDAASDLLARRGVGGFGKLGQMPETKSQSPPPIPVSVSTSHPYFWAPFILVGEGK